MSALIVSKPGEKDALRARAARRLMRGEMPPAESKLKLSHSQRKVLIEFLSAGLVRPSREVPLRRLNRGELNHAVSDLFEKPLSFSASFPDDEVGYGFDTVGDVLSFSQLHLERAVTAAEALARDGLRELSPQRLRFEAEEAFEAKDGADFRIEGGHGGAQGRYGVLYSNGAFRIRFKPESSGEFILRARVYGDQGGEEPVRVRMGRLGAEGPVIDVRARSRAPEVIERTIFVEARPTILTLSFINDFWEPKAKPPVDRNLGVDWIEILSPAARPSPSALERELERLPEVKSREDWPRVAEPLILWLVERAWRGAAPPAELKALTLAFERAAREARSLEEALREVIVLVLLSPRFLFRIEEGASAGLVSESALATRLSLFLWSSIPDEALRRKAKEGGLRTALSGEVERMLDDVKASRFVKSFTGQWLQLRRMAELRPDKEVFPEFDEDLRQAMRAETEALFEVVLREHRSAMDLIDANFTFVNERLAKHYQIEGVRGAQLRRVALPAERGGLLGHASILTMSSGPTRHSPVQRGKWILEVLFDDPPPPPSPGSDSLAPLAKGSPNLSLRERLQAHRAKAECASCHDRMDPLGFALDAFNGIGAYERRREGQAIDDRGRLPSGREIQGLKGLREVIGERRGDFVKGLIRQLLIYALGRGTSLEDEGLIGEIYDKTAPRHNLRDIIREIALSRAMTSP